jgi:hypothetical protein
LADNCCSASHLSATELPSLKQGAAQKQHSLPDDAEAVVAILVAKADLGTDRQCEAVVADAVGAANAADAVGAVDRAVVAARAVPGSTGHGSRDDIDVLPKKKA